MMKRYLLVSALLLAPATVFGQAREEKTNSLTYRGVDANAQTDPANHTMNRHPTVPRWGGCCPSSVRTAALHAGLPRDEIDRFWAIAQRKVGVGGTHPELLAVMLYEAFGESEPWISYLSSNPEEVRDTLDKLSARGICIAGTMGWGAPELYGSQRIAHMVNVPHFSTADDLACVEDNNDPPGVYRWMSSSEYLARCVAGGQAWVFAFTRERPVMVAASAALLLFAAAILLLASSLALLGWLFALSPQPQPRPQCM